MFRNCIENKNIIKRSWSAFYKNRKSNRITRSPFKNGQRSFKNLHPPYFFSSLHCKPRRFESFCRGNSARKRIRLIMGESSAFVPWNFTNFQDLKKKTFGNSWRKEVGRDKKKNVIRKIEDEKLRILRISKYLLTFSIEITNESNIQIFFLRFHNFKTPILFNICMTHYASSHFLSNSI